MNFLKLSVMPDRLAVCWLPAVAAVPSWVMDELTASSIAQRRFLSITRTVTELSVVCEEGSVPPGVRAERGWRALVVEGPLDFSLTGILAGLAQTLAEAGVSIFAISTFETDIILVKEEMLVRAVDALNRAGYELHV